MTNLPGKKLLNYASVGFFVVSLIAIAGTVSNPIKKQLIAAFAAIDEPPWTEYYTPTPRPTPTRTPTLRPTPTKTPTSTPTPVKTPFCSSFIVHDCIYGCIPNTGGGSCKPAPTPARTPTRTPTPVKTPYCSAVNQRDCSYGCTASLTGGYCKPAPTKTPTLTPRSTSTPIPTAYCSTTLQRECLYGCVANLSGGNCRPAPTRTPTPRISASPLALATPYCSSATTRDCLYGCIADLNGGHCKPAPTGTPTPRFTVNPYSYFTLPPTPTKTPVIYYYPTTRPTATPLRTPTRIPTTASTTNGYSLSLIVNQTADPNRPGFDCRANPGVCPSGVEVSGFYKAPNGLYYPIAPSAGGPSVVDLQYIQKNYEELRKTPTPTATPVSLAQLFGSNGATNIFTGKTPTATPFDIVTFMNTITMGPPKPTPTRTPVGLAGGPTLNQTVGSNSLNAFVTNTGAAFTSTLTNILSYLTSNPTPKPIPSTTTSTTSDKYSCANGYILKTNQFGAAYCQEDPNTWDSSKYVLKCRDDGSCSKCTTGFFSSCTTIPSIEAKSTQTTIQVIATTKGIKSLGASCSTGSECQSGNCVKSWINSDGSRSVALTNRCVYSQSEQNAFTAAADKRETETVAYTAAGLAIPATVVALPGVATTAFTTYGQLATGTLPALAQASVNVVSQIVPAVTVGGLTYGAGDCAFGYAGGEACKIAGELALTGYTTDPIGFTQMFQQVGQLPSTVKNTVTAIRNVTRTTAEVPTLESGVVYDAVTGQATTFRPDSSKIIDLDFIPDEIIPPLPANVSNTSQLFTSGANNSTTALQLTGSTINSGALVLPAINPTTAVTNPVWTALTVAVTTPIKNLAVNSLSSITSPLSIAPTIQTAASNPVNLPNLYTGTVPSTKTTGAITGTSLTPNTQNSTNLPNPDNSLSTVIDNVDKAVTQLGGPRDPGCRGYLCGFSSNWVAYESEQAGLTAAVYEVKDLNAARGVLPSSSRQHFMTIVQDSSGNRFITDLTIGQFYDDSVNNPIVQALLKDGAIPLTEENLNKYLDLLSSTPGNTLTINELANVKPTPLDIWESDVELLNSVKNSGTVPDSVINNTVFNNPTPDQVPVYTTPSQTPTDLIPTTPLPEKPLLERILDPIRNLIKPATPAETGMIRYSQDTQVPQLVETGEKSWISSIKDSVDSAISRITNSGTGLTVGALPDGGITTAQKDTNIQLTDILTERIKTPLNEPLTVISPNQTKGNGVFVTENAGPANPITVFKGGTADPAKYVIPDNQLGPASAGSGMVAVIEDINPNSVYGSQIIKAFEDSAAINGLDTIVVPHIKDLPTVDLLSRNGFVPTSMWQPSQSTLPPTMVKNIQVVEPESARGTTGAPADFPATSAIAQDSIDQIMARRPDESLEDYFRRYSQFMNGQQTVAISNPDSQTVGQQIFDKLEPIVEGLDNAALGWWKPRDFEPPALTEPKIPTVPIVPKPVPVFDEGSKFFDIVEYPQLQIKPGDLVRTSTGRLSNPVQIPVDGQLMYVQEPGKGYVAKTADIYVRINNSPAAPTPLIKMPPEGMVFNTTDRLQIYHVEKLAEEGIVTLQKEYLIGTVSTSNTKYISIERDPDRVFFSPGDNFITSGVSTVLRSPADVVAYGFMGHYPLAETIWQWTDSFTDLANAINSGAIVLTGGDDAAQTGMQVWQSVTSGPGNLVPTEKPGLIPKAIEKIKSWIIPGSATSTSFTPTSNDDQLNALVTRIDNAFENAGAPNGIGCRTELCETASGYVKIDADNSGLVVNNYNVAQANGLRGGDSSTLVTHEFSIAFNNNGEPQAIIDLTMPQFTYIDFTDPLAKEMLEKGYVKYTTENFNHYLDLIGNKPLQAVDDTILNKLNSHQPYISEERKQQYLQKGLIDLTPEKSPEAPEKVWTPVPDWEDEPVLPLDNEIFVISPDVKPGERFVETLKGSGWTPTNFNTDIVARVIDGTLNVPVNFAASTLGNDLADAITWGYNCGFGNIAISCNTAQLPEVIDVVWPLLPQKVRDNVTLLTTFDAVEKAYQGKTLPLVIGTTPTANSLAQNAKLPTLISVGKPEIQEKIQRLIWLEKQAQGSVLPTGPTEIQSMTPENARLLADSLSEEIIGDLKNLGTTEVIVACTDITTLCARKDAGINFRDPAEFIRPPGSSDFPPDNNMQVWQETTIQVQPNFPNTTTTIQDIKTKIQNTIHNSIYNGPLGDKLFGNVSIDLFDPVSKSLIEGVGIKVRDLDTLSPTDPKLSPLQQAIVKDLLDHGTVVYLAHVPSLKLKSYAHGLEEHNAAAVAGAPFVNLNNILVSDNVLNDPDFFPFALEHELGHFNTPTQYREALTARQQVEDEISANQSAIDALEEKFAVVDGDPAMKIAEERLESDLAWLQKLQDNPSLDPILTEIKKGEFSVGNQGIVYRGVYTKVTEIKPDTIITILPNDIVATNDYLIIPSPNRPNTETIYWRQLDKNGKPIPSLPLQKLESEGITLDLKQYGGFEIGIKDAEGMLYYPDTLAWSNPPRNSKNYRPLNNIAIFDPNYRPVIVRQSDAANSSQTLQGKIRNAISDLIMSINETLK